MKPEQTLVLIKPDAFQRCFVGEIISRLERKGLRVQAAKLMQLDEETGSRHYADHKGKEFSVLPYRISLCRSWYQRTDRARVIFNLCRGKY